MSVFDLATYVLILLSVTLAPGPLIAIIIARTMNKDAKGAMAITLGMASGDVLIIAMIYAGLGVWLKSVPEVLYFAKFGGMLYLFWLAYDLWVNKSQGAEVKPDRQSGLLSSAVFGFSSCFFTPHSILLYLLLLPQLMDITRVSITALALFCALTFGALVMAFGAVILVSARVRNRAVGCKNNIWINRTLATVIALSGVWMVTA